MYRNEAAFSRALCTSLEDKHVFVQRIESGLTGRGIPDIYMRWPVRDMWVELKNDYRVSVKDKAWFIHWRRGQKAWSMRYRKIAKKQCTYTVVAMKDGFAIIPMDKAYAKNRVLHNQAWLMTSLSDIYDVLKHEAEK